VSAASTAGDRSRRWWRALGIALGAIVLILGLAAFAYGILLISFLSGFGSNK
jgi:4-amino-4-deoxy-L-arabinose transferase-like glycosyltransferase